MLTQKNSAKMAFLAYNFYGDNLTKSDNHSSILHIQSVLDPAWNSWSNYFPRTIPNHANTSFSDGEWSVDVNYILAKILLLEGTVTPNIH